MKMKLIFWCCLLVLLGSCSDEDSGTMRELIDWFEIKDNPNDDLQHLTYLIYKDTGIPIFYNDTIGREERGVNVDGSPYYYYEILDGGYTLPNTAQLSYKISPNRNKIKSGIELLRERVIPRLPKETKVNSFLLVDTIFQIFNGMVKIELSTYRSMMTTLVGKIIYMDELTDADKDILAGEVIATTVATYLVKNANAELVDFYAITNNIESPLGKNNYGAYIGTWMEMGKEDFGCIYAIDDEGYGFYLPKKEEDLEDFIAVYYGWKETDFLEKYKDYPYVIQKYKWIKNFIEQKFK